MWKVAQWPTCSSYPQPWHQATSLPPHQLLFLADGQVSCPNWYSHKPERWNAIWIFLFSLNPVSKHLLNPILTHYYFWLSWVRTCFHESSCDILTTGTHSHDVMRSHLLSMIMMWYQVTCHYWVNMSYSYNNILQHFCILHKHNTQDGIKHICLIKDQSSQPNIH